MTYPMKPQCVLLLNSIRKNTLKRNLTRFKLLDHFGSKSKLWQVYMDEAMPHIMNELTMSSQLTMNFSRQVVHHDAYVLINIVASRCFVSVAFANTFG